MATIEELLARKRKVPEEPRVGRTATDQLVHRMLLDSPQTLSEIERICSIPIQQPFSDSDIEAIQLLHVKPEALESGFRLQRVQAEAIQTFQEVGSLFGPIAVGGGKCVLGSTEIFDRRAGMRRTVYEAVEARHIAVDACDENSLKFSTRGAVAMASGAKQCCQVTLASGQSVGLSLDHKVLTAFGWVEAGMLRKGDLIATPRSLCPGRGLSEPTAAIHLLAYLLADGGISGGSVVFVDDNPHTIAEVQACADRLGMGSTVSPERSKAYRVNITKALPFTRKWGIQGKLSKNKRLPARLFDMDRQQTVEFLGRFWTCDGHIQKNGKMECTLASEGLLKDLRHLLLYIGVCCSIQPKTASCNGKTYPAWRMTISGADAERFLREVHFPGQDNRRNEALDHLERTKRNPNTDIVPITWGDHRNFGLSIPLSAIKKELSLTPGQWVGRDTFDAFCKKHYLNHRMSGNEIRWSKVADVTSLGLRDVYDLSVDQHHNFVADGVVVHNTAIALRCLAIAFENGVQRAALFVPSQVHTQLVEHDISWARKRMPLGYTVYPLGGLSPQKRMAMAGGRRGVWIVPYSLLSARDASELLERIRPELMIFDEAHLLKNRTAARTKRILSYCKEHHPRVSALSGTMSSKSIKDFAHLITQALGENAPVPKDAQVVSDWASTIDSEQAAEGHYQARTNTGPLRPLINWSNKNFPKTPLDFTVQGFRHAFRNRLLTTPGVVSSPPDSLGTSLYIENVAVKSPTPRLQELQDQLEELWLTPSGDEIEFAMQKWKWATELSAGIYNDLVWPDAGQVAERRRVAPGQAEDWLKRSKDHHKMQQAYHKELRGWFQSHAHKPGLDTPMLVGASMARYGDRDVGSKLYTAWLTMKNLEFDEMVERDSIPVRVCDYKMQATIRIMKASEAGEGIVFYHHQTAGKWLVELAEAAGVPVVHCPAGKAANDFLTSEGAERRCRGKWLICSISAHGTGKNLQFLSDQIYLQIPHNEMMAQQSIGRTHRQGQKADSVTCTTLISNKQDELILASLLNDSIYMLETSGDSRKLLLATWNPMPTTYGTHQLQRAGLQSKILTAKQQLMLTERFSSS